MKKIPYVLFSMLVLTSLLFEGCDRLPILFGSTSKKCMIEYDYETFNDWNYGWSAETFKHDFSFDKAPTSENISTFGYHYFYTGSTLCSIQVHFQNYGHRSYQETKYPNYVVQSYYIWVTGLGDGILGISNNYRRSDTQTVDYCQNIRNWSFIFRSNIDSWNTQISGSYVSAVNYVYAHELAHQVGNAIYDGVHDDHDGDAPDQCVLNWPNSSIIDTVRRLASSFGLCPNHRNFTKNGPDLRTSTFTGQSAGSYQYNKLDNKSQLNINLAKNEFKQFEPILANIQYINNHEKTDTIYFNFIDIHDRAAQFYIKSEANVLYSKRIQEMPWLVYDKPQYMVKTNDTFNVSMVVNHNYGERVNKDNKVFNHYGYFKPGKYKLYVEDKIGGELLRSNEVEFEVTELNDEDTEILRLAQDNKLQDIISNHINSVFAEHVFAQYCMNLYPYESEDKNISQLTEAYGGFIRQFPQSLYNENILFVDSYFDKITKQTNSLQWSMLEMKAKSENSLFIRFIQKEAVKERLVKNYSSLKKAFNEEEQNKNK